jgi:tetratricopeptide (TPR) repeat protein
MGRPTLDDIIQLCRARRLPEAEDACRRLLEAEPANDRAGLLAGEIAMARGDKVGAQARLREIAQRITTDGEIRYNAALALGRSGDLPGAAAVLRELAAKHADVFPVLFDLAQLEETLGRPQAALPAYEAAIKINPGNAGPFTRRAVLLLRETFGAPRPTPPEKRQNPGSTHRITMSTLGWNGRFGNQLLQYAVLRALGEVHGLAVEAPEWIGRWLFDLDDPYPRAPMTELREDGDNIASLLSRDHRGTADIADRDLWGYCCYHTRHLRPHRALVQRLFTPGENLRLFAQAAMAKIRARGKTLVALHLRRGDFGYGRFWIAPETWYLEWLRSLWPHLDRPVLYIASDDETIFRKFADYAPVTAADFGAPIRGAEFYGDFHVLSQADHLAISNSSFSFVAGLLNERGQSFMRPDLAARRLVAYDPWDADVLLPDPEAPTMER